MNIYAKIRVPAKLRQEVWITYMGNKFSSKCKIKWCKTKIDVFHFEAGHNIPKSKGGETTLENLRPICSSCNKSMSNKYTIDDWNKLGNRSVSCCF